MSYSAENMTFPYHLMYMYPILLHEWLHNLGLVWVRTSHTVYPVYIQTWNVSDAKLGSCKSVISSIPGEVIYLTKTCTLQKYKGFSGFYLHSDLLPISSMETAGNLLSGYELSAVAVWELPWPYSSLKPHPCFPVICSLLLFS